MMKISIKALLLTSSLSVLLIGCSSNEVKKEPVKEPDILQTTENTSKEERDYSTVLKELQEKEEEISKQELDEFIGKAENIIKNSNLLSEVQKTFKVKELKYSVGLGMFTKIPSKNVAIDGEEFYVQTITNQNDETFHNLKAEYYYMDKDGNYLFSRSVEKDILNPNEPWEMKLSWSHPSGKSVLFGMKIAMYKLTFQDSSNQTYTVDINILGLKNAPKQ